MNVIIIAALCSLEGCFKQYAFSKLAFLSQSKKKGKDQASIQSSTTPDPGSRRILAATQERHNLLHTKNKGTAQSVYP